MSASSLSVFVFGIYILIVGTGFLFIPNRILPVLKFPKANEPWIRIMAVIIIVLGVYYVVASQNELTQFYWATVYGRFGILIGFSSLVVLKKAPLPLILFGVIDSVGAVWTLLTLL